ncbi:glycine oxidase ThiO [Garicola koreensis]
MVGAGVVGLVTAWRLRLAGHAVTVIDPAPASEATYAAAGMLAPISEVQYGQETLWPIMTAAQREYPQLIESLSRATDAPTGYCENGTLQVAADASDRNAAADLVDVQRAAGMTVEPLTSSALRRREPSLAPGLAKAWDVPSDHQVDPRILAAAITTALNTDLTARHRAAGPPVTWVRRRVIGVEEQPDGDQRPIAITTDDGQQRHFDRTALVPGMGYSDIAGIPQQNPLPLREVHGDVLRLRVRPEQLMTGEPHLLGATVRAKVAGRSVYLVPREDGGLVIGASSREDGLVGTHVGSVAELLEDAIRVLPAVREMELVEITSRARPATPDDRPYLGHPGRQSAVVVSTGFHRHGVLLAPLAARLTTALLSDEELNETDHDVLASLSPSR